jgi:hypothetical protein
VSPILVRPVREQLEHDRVIRMLQARYRRKFEVAVNVGAEQGAAVGSGTTAVYPDLVLSSPDRGRKLQGVVEVETTESVNHLEAMAQWARFAKLKAPLHLYVPAVAVDSARRLCADHDIAVAEVWSYHSIADQMRFTLIHRAPVPEPRRSATTAAPPRSSSRPARAVAAVSKRRPAKSAGRSAAKKAPSRAQKRR